VSDTLHTAIRGFAQTVMGKLEEVRAENRELRERMADAERRATEVESRAAVVPVVDLDAIAAMVTEQVRAAVEAIPVPKDGADGSGITVDDVRPMLEDAVRAAVDALPAPAPGKDADPVDLDEVAKRAAALIPVPVDGKDGADGKDGIATRDELNAIVEERFADIQTRTLADIYRGVFKTDGRYARGDTATFGGGLWLALADGSDKPGTSDQWRLIVKRGADAR
jgi:hypothetical protein